MSWVVQLLRQVAALPAFEARRVALEDLGVVDAGEAAALLGERDIQSELAVGGIPVLLRSEVRQIAIFHEYSWIRQDEPPVL
jgi:hypothetical protein